MLAGTCLGNNPLFSHALDQKSLAHNVICLMCPGLVEIFTLNVDPATAKAVAEVLSVCQRGRTAGITGHNLKIFLPEGIIFFYFLKIGGELFKRLMEDFRDKGPSPVSVITFFYHSCFRNLLLIASRF